MDEFELAGFDEEICEQLREIIRRIGLDSYALISSVRANQEEATMIFVEPTYGAEKLEEKIVNIKITQE